MNKYPFFIFLIVACIAHFTFGNNSSFPTEQLVKTCCRDTEGFDIITGNCVSLINLHNATFMKTDELNPYLGSWKRKKTPRLSHEAPTCGYENYEILEAQKKIVLNGNYIEISEIRRENPEVIKSFSFEYFSDYCIELAINNTKSENDTSMIGVIQRSCNPLQGHVKSSVKLCCPFKKSNDEPKNTCGRQHVIDAYAILDDVPRYRSFQYQSKRSVVPNHDIQTTFVFGDASYKNYSIECLLWQDLKIGRKELVLYDDGRINVDGSNYNHKEYCISDIKQIEQSENSGYSALIQYCQYPSWYMIWVSYVEPILYLVSNLCLLFLMIYTTLNKGSKVFGAMMVAIPFNLLICYLGITVAKLWGRNIQHMASHICLINGIVIYFSYLSVMFWLNTLCFDVWSSFHSMRAPNMLRVNVGRFDGFKDQKFKRYALYGWGVPFIITTITLIMQFLPMEYTNGFVTPGFGEQRCFLGSRLTVEWKSKLYYLLFPAGIALLLNVILFVLFVWNLCCGIWANQSGDPSVR